MFAPVQTQLSYVVGRAAAADASLFKPGQVLEALVLGKAPDGMVALKIGDIVVTAQLPQTLPPGTTLQLQVKAGGPAPQLTIVGTPQMPAAQPPAPAPVLPQTPVLVTVPQAAPIVPQPAVQPLAGQPAVLPSSVPVPAAPAALQQPPVAPQAPSRVPAPAPPGQVTVAPPANAALPTPPRAPQAVAPPSVIVPPKSIVESRQPLAPPSTPIDSSAPRPSVAVAQARPAAANVAAQLAVSAQLQPLPATPPQSALAVQPAPTAPMPALHAAAPPQLPSAAGNPAVLVAAASVPNQPVAVASQTVVAAAVAASPAAPVQLTSAPQVASALGSLPPAQVAGPPASAPVPAATPTAPVTGHLPVAPQVPATATPSAPASVVAPQPQTAPLAQPASPATPTAATAPAVSIALGAPPAEPAMVSPLLVAQGAPRPQLTTADLPRAPMLPPGSPQVQSQPVPATPAAALAQMVPEAMARQNSLAPLLSSLATLAARPAGVPEPVLRAAVQLLAQRVPVPPSGPTAQMLEATLAKSGVFLEAGLAKGAPAADVKSALVALRGAAATWLGGNPAPVTPTQQPVPPLRGLPPRAEPADLPPLPEAPREAARAIHTQADSALSRVKLMQMASLPDADPARAPVPELRMEVPFLVGQQVVMAQFQVLRDREQQRSDGKRGWTMRFAMNFAEAGEIGAEVGLLGQSVNVALWAADPETAADLEAALPELAPALAALGLDPGAVRVRSAPAEPARASSGHFVDSRR
jgi:hypothetical protein